MGRKIFVLFFVFLFVFVIGCTKNADEPLGIAEKFWDAVKNDDIETAKSYATKATANSLMVKDDKGDPRDKVTFGEVKFEDEKAEVETTLHSFANTTGTEMTIPIKTILVQEDSDWKVDVNLTMMSLFGGAMGEMMQQMGDAMKEGMEGMGKAMAEGMKEGMEEMGKTMGEGMQAAGQGQ